MVQPITSHTRPLTEMRRWTPFFGDPYSVGTFPGIAQSLLDAGAANVTGMGTELIATNSEPHARSVRHSIRRAGLSDPFLPEGAILVS